LATNSSDAGHKAAIDALLLQIRGVEGEDMSGMSAYFVNKKMFACIHGKGVAIRLPTATATELQFSRADVSSFQPGGKASSREWIQINHEDPAEYKNDLEVFQASIEFVKATRSK
jgi:hypothetical protein